MRDENPDGVPLSHYREHAGCGVRFCCNACARSFDVPLERVISRLERQGLGGPSTGIRAVAGLATRSCDRCGGRSWETRPAFASGAYTSGVIPPTFLDRSDS